MAKIIKINDDICRYLVGLLGHRVATNRKRSECPGDDQISDLRGVDGMIHLRTPLGFSPLTHGCLSVWRLFLSRRRR